MFLEQQGVCPLGKDWEMGEGEHLTNLGGLFIDPQSKGGGKDRMNWGCLGDRIFLSPFMEMVTSLELGCQIDLTCHACALVVTT